MSHEGLFFEGCSSNLSFIFCLLIVSFTGYYMHSLCRIDLFISTHPCEVYYEILHLRFYLIKFRSKEKCYKMRKYFHFIRSD